MIKAPFVAIAALAVGGCHQQASTWPKANDVYHRQILLPPADGMWAGLHFVDPKTGKSAPEVCDTYGDGQTVCSRASFDKALPVAQVRADIARREREAL